MKYIVYTIVLAGILLSGFTTVQNSNVVNKVIGDDSYLTLKGTSPDNTISEVERISIHLAYVEDILRKKEIKGLSKKQRENRAKNLNLLKDYRTRQEYPSNYDYKGQRKPCFRDKNDRICAVGYLVQQNGSEELVQQIESSMNYAYIEDMDNQDLALWVENSGLTVEECAMIQPTYSWTPSPDLNYISPGYGAASASLIGFNVAASTISLMQLNKEDQHWIMPLLGIGSGVSQLTMGAVLINRYDQNGYYVYKRHENLSMANMLIGTASVVLNSYSLIKSISGKKQRRDLSWNAYAVPTGGTDISFGFNLVKRL